MKIKIEGSFKAVKDLEFEFKKGLTLITGYNGAGKSQLLNLINTVVSQTVNTFEDSYTFSQVHPSIDNNEHYSVKLESFRIQENGANILWSDNYGQTVFQGNILYKDFKEVCLELYSIINPKQKSQILSTLGKEIKNENGRKVTPRIISNAQLANMIQSLSHKLILEVLRLSNKSKEDILPADIFRFFPIHILVTELQPSQSDQILSFYFYCHQYKIAYNIKNNITDDLGEAPWEIFQLVIDSLGFNYKVTAPDISKLSDILDMELNQMSETPYQIVLLDNDSGKKINFHDLSSGERQLFSIGMLRYSTELRNNKRKLILLDEPDAHLHPSMIKQFFEIVNEFLVKKNNIKVIMTTHSASTLTLASNYENLELYFMKRSSEFESTTLEVDNSIKFSRSIKSLSNGLFTIYPETKFVIVEDLDDVSFYNCICEFSKNENISMLNFIASSKLTENGEGGKDAVLKSLNYLRKLDVLTSNSSSVVGLIDKDTGNIDYDENGFINLINRYSIENYWFDPLIVYCFLLNGKDPEFKNLDILKIKSGQEFNIRKLSNQLIQEQVDLIVNKISNKIIFSNTIEYFEFNSTNKTLKSPKRYEELTEISYLNGHKIKIPKWIIEVRGKDLRQIYQDTFINASKLNKEASYKYFRSTNHIPKELITKIETFL
ncbi:ATP-dependent nuclease [Polaribacter vadi]|uniref:ATP-dependent nuclease n=1 Tax=Polaribacter vadi TaxID=1774273 RepID=UPI0030ED951D|tara:strand:+ start:11178 stop:13163 length:1986 start_codon:yes stop_codon:yes gene_type:complete